MLSSFFHWNNLIIHFFNAKEEDKYIWLLVQITHLAAFIIKLRQNNLKERKSHSGCSVYYDFLI